MNQSDYAAFKVVLTATAQMYGKTMAPAVIELWWNAMKGYDLAAVRDGFSRHVQNPDTGQFMPKPADIVRMMGGTTQDSALAAWAKVDRAVRGLGTYVSVVFDDPIIHAVLADMGGWVAMGMKTEKDWPFVAREFENRYRGYRTLGAIENYPPVLAGVFALENAASGQPVPEPTLIGDRAQALRTRQFGSDALKLRWHRPDAPEEHTLPAPAHEPPPLRLHND